MSNDFNVNEWKRNFIHESNSPTKSQEPQEIISTLNKIYHTISGDIKHYLEIPEVENLLKTLEKYK